MELPRAGKHSLKKKPILTNFGESGGSQLRWIQCLGFKVAEKGEFQRGKGNPLIENENVGFGFFGRNAFKEGIFVAPRQ